MVRSRVEEEIVDPTRSFPPDNHSVFVHIQSDVINLIVGQSLRTYIPARFGFNNFQVFF